MSNVDLLKTTASHRRWKFLKMSNNSINIKAGDDKMPGPADKNWRDVYYLKNIHPVGDESVRPPDISSSEQPLYRREVERWGISREVVDARIPLIKEVATSVQDESIAINRSLQLASEVFLQGCPEAGEVLQWVNQTEPISGFNHGTVPAIITLHYLIDEAKRLADGPQERTYLDNLLRNFRKHDWVLVHFDPSKVRTALNYLGFGECL